MKKLSYLEWFDLARECRANAIGGNVYRMGVEREAALAAFEQQQHGCGTDAIIDVITDAFRRYDIPQYRPAPLYEEPWAV